MCILKREKQRDYESLFRCLKKKIIFSVTQGKRKEHEQSTIEQTRSVVKFSHSTIGENRRIGFIGSVTVQPVLEPMVRLNSDPGPRRIATDGIFSHRETRRTPVLKSGTLGRLLPGFGLVER